MRGRYKGDSRAFFEIKRFNRLEFNPRIDYFLFDILLQHNTCKYNTIPRNNMQIYRYTSFMQKD